MNKEIIDNLSSAVSNGRTDIVRSLLSVCENGTPETGGASVPIPELLTEPCNSVGTLLHLATKLDHIDIVRTLLSSGAHPNIENSYGETPIDLVQSQQMTAVYVDELLKCSAKSEFERIHELVNAGVDVNSQDSPESKNTALHWAVCFGKPESVQCLLDLGASTNVLNGQGVSPLHEGVKRKNLEIIRLLLSSGADPALKSSLGKYLGKTPLDMADGNVEVSNLLMEYASKDSESDRSDILTATEDSRIDQSTRNSLGDLSASLHSLSTSSEPSPKSVPSYAPQSMHVPPFLSTPLPLITDSKLHTLWPQPQKLVQIDGENFKMKQELAVHVVLSGAQFSTLSVLDAWSIHRENFKVLGYLCDVENISQSISDSCGDIICHINSQLFPRADSYKINVSCNQILILASDIVGMHYALCTLEQLFSLYSEDRTLPPLFIHDWPELQHRAVLLDFSSGARKPTMETLKGYIQVMSSLKVKQIHCYFRYEQNTLNKSPLSNTDLIELSRFCSRHFIELVPAIDVGVAEKHIVVKERVTEPAHHLMALLSSKSLQIGPNLSKVLLQEILVSKNSKIIWDMLLLPTSTIIYLYYSSSQRNNDWLRLLPLNCILIDYGYQVEHDYELNSKVITQSGCNVCIGIGTTSWGSVAGSPETAIPCIRKAAAAAANHGALGFLVADWQTLPHHPAFCFSWPDVALGLGLSWNSSVHEDYLHIRLQELLNLWVYSDPGQIVGYLTVELGRLETFMHRAVFGSHKDSALCPSGCRGSVVHQLLIDPDNIQLDNFTAELLQQVIRHVKKFELELQKADPMCFQHGELILELRLAMDLIMFACRLGKVMVTTGLNPNSKSSCGLAVINVGISNLPPISRTDLANKLLALIEQFRAVWLSRNLSCGLQTSLSLFNTLLLKLIPESDERLIAIDRESPFLHDIIHPQNGILRKPSVTA